MKPKVAMQFGLRLGALERIQEVADVVIDPTLAGEAVGADALVLGGGKCDGEVMDRLGPNLKVIARPGIGVDSVDIPAATARGILVINTPDAPTESTAEHAVALMMTVCKRVMAGDRMMRGDESVDRSDLLGTELLDRNLGVLGYGRIGRRVAEICALGLRMNVMVYDPIVPLDTPTPERVTLTSDMDAVLKQADVLTIHVPLLPQTRQLIGEREMHLMPKGSYFINASRGPVVDEAALIRCMQEGHFAAAGLDVFDPEPPDPSNPLLAMKNVVTTPHIASGTDRGVYAMMHGVADQIIQILNGEKPPYLLDPNAWPGRVKAK
ncbi:MAG: hydroxyacid dehydrogenase [Caldilineaceae bacterium]|nr:hydroxyacid dehydrogenase [Caldilineaceae bacterium]